MKFVKENLNEWNKGDANSIVKEIGVKAEDAFNFVDEIIDEYNAGNLEDIEGVLQEIKDRLHSIDFIAKGANVNPEYF